MKNIVVIEFEAGSEWQDKLQMNSLELMILSWKTHAESKHKKNKIKITKTKED